MIGRGRRLSLADQVAVERLLDEAFAPARAGGTGLSPARARARARWTRPERPAARWRLALLLGRLGETSLAAGLTGMVLVATLAGVGLPAPTAGDPTPGARLSAPLDERTFLRLVRLGRAAPLADDLDPALGLIVPQPAEAEAPPLPRELAQIPR